MSGFIYGNGPTAAAVRKATGLEVVTDLDAVTEGPVVFALEEADTADSALTGLLERGIDVVSTAHTGLSTAELQGVCARGGATYHQVGIFEFIMGRSMPTALQTLRLLRSFRVVERRDLPSASDTELDRLKARRVDAVRRSVAVVYDDLEDVQVEATRDGHKVEVEATSGGRVICRVVSHFDDSTASDTYFPAPSGTVSYALDADSDPTDTVWQTDLPNEGSIPGALAGLVVEALPFVTAAGPGVVVEDPTPLYQNDARVTRITR